MKRLHRITMLLLLASAIISCDQKNDIGTQYVSSQSVLIVKEDKSESGQRELHIHVKAKNPESDVLIRIQVPNSAEIEGIWHHTDSIVFSLQGDSRTYRFDHSELLANESMYRMNGLQPLDKYK